ncbi:TetR/AcrR family transcriptional regulator [Amycolatopsis anabasis]|uniref:TetR/AcrR family transcriptional regulator n=1 Tax=Amycolatopsis anabasis TaxID=1840409 RepID=UPI001FE883E7|nr:TetR family transcriptional regulator [Amycolatopsis anabasis]
MTQTGQPMGLRERKRFETHRALSSTAVRLVAARGLDHVTVEDISAEVGVSARTFFNYFASKEDAVLIPYPDHAERAERTAGRVIDAPAELTALRAFMSALREDIEVIENDREEWLMRMSVLEKHPGLISRIIVAQADAERTIIAAIARRVGLDPVDDFYPALLYSVVGGALQAAIRRWYLREGRQPLAALVESAVDAVAHGLPEPHQH